MASTAARAAGNSGRVRINIGVDVQNAAELQANAQHVLASTRVARLRNTTRNYGPKKKEFQVRIDDIQLKQLYYILTLSSMSTSSS
jgi:multidrug efflux pump subunit AcrB